MVGLFGQPIKKKKKKGKKLKEEKKAHLLLKLRYK